MKTREAANGKWPGILQHFGIEPDFLRNRNGPCPMCGGKDRWRFDDKDGAGTFYCNQCGAGDGFRLLELWTGRDFRELAKEVDGIVGNIDFTPPPPKKDPVKRLKHLQSGVVPMDGINPVRMYLRSRGLQPTPAMSFNPSVGYYEGGKKTGSYPAMLCRMISPEGAPLTYHITYLTPQGRKAPVSSARKMASPVSPLNGSAIRLFPVAEHIAVAEGIETALAVHKLFNMPCWACANATLLEQFEPPEGVKSVSIFADNDMTFTGHKAAYNLAYRLQQKIPTTVTVPPIPGTDFADELLKLEEGA